MHDEKDTVLGALAEETLAKLKTVANTAKEHLHKATGNLTPDVFACGNTLIDSTPNRNLAHIRLEGQSDYEALEREPAIARVVVQDPDGGTRIYFICRATPGPDFTNPATDSSRLASYRSPVGRLAALPIGADFSLPPKGTKVKVVERALLHPIEKEQWDSVNTVVEHTAFDTCTIISLKDLLKGASGDASFEDILEQVLAEDRQRANVVEGYRRSVIKKMALRDQPILDQHQDKIFRLPLVRSSLFIEGPPGTGKTTTLIRRLGQKLDKGFLEEKEREVVESVERQTTGRHERSWLMFSPTDLLKQFLKEAFAQEGIPASDLQIHTWSDHRWHLSRDIFTVLRTPTGKGTYILNDVAKTFQDTVLADSISWFVDFRNWQRTAFVELALESADELVKDARKDVSAIGRRIISILRNSGSGSLSSALHSMAEEAAAVQKVLDDIRGVTDDKIRGALNLQLKSNRSFLDELAKFTASIDQSSDRVVEYAEDQDIDEEEVTVPNRTERAAAFTAYSQAIRAQARAVARGRLLKKSTRNSRIIEWLGTRGMQEDEYLQVGRDFLLQSSLRNFVSPAKGYIDSIPRLYRSFRRIRQSENKWYSKSSFDASDLHPLELDVVLLSILEESNSLLRMPQVQRSLGDHLWSFLKPLVAEYKNQVVVDEATDFSAIQLACMFNLCHPKVASFFACGDFHQRLTTWGTRSFDEMTWAVTGLNVVKINVAYRQSRQLNEFIGAVLSVGAGEKQTSTLPVHCDNEGVAPCLLENAYDNSVVAAWLADRIREIEAFVRCLPSIALFVESETEVQRLEEELKRSLLNDNVQVFALRRAPKLDNRRG